MRSAKRAFSLVEVMIVVVIIGLMSTMVVFATTRYLDKAKRQRARAVELLAETRRGLYRILAEDPEEADDASDLAE